MKELMKEEKTRLTELIKQLESSLRDTPEGTFYVVRNKRYTKWFLYKNRKNILIPKTKKDQARKFAIATINRILLKQTKEELDAVNAYLRNVGETDTDQYLNEHPDLRELINESPSWPDYARKWANEPYKKSDKDFKGTLYQTLKGDLVKSKAEKEIADALFIANIPYRYECGISFDNGKTYYYPDFTIMDPETGKIYFWEHFGMEDLNYYIRQNTDKIYTYFFNGIVPGKNLICTVSDDKTKLTKADIQKTIKFYFKK